MTSPLTVEVLISAPLEKVWQYWNEPEHMTGWCFASDDWHAPRATNNLAEGESFTIRMEAKDGSAGFDMGGTYTLIEDQKKIEYVMDDGRKVSITFESDGEQVRVTETFDAETENSLELQQQGWQAILENFKKYVESN
jgi:uncharacterized protein YndB with AHSA1/START domain